MWHEDGVEWVWTDEKNRLNKRGHGISFEAAKYVFGDPLIVSRPDFHPDGDRWQTIGQAGPTTLFVVHTWPEPNPITGEQIGRIISARKATPYERKAYEEGNF